jgi:hypothetical protein
MMMRFLFFFYFFFQTIGLSNSFFLVMKKVMNAYERDLGFGDIFNQCVMRRKSAQKKKTNVKVLLEANTSLQ